MSRRMLFIGSASLAAALTIMPSPALAYVPSNLESFIGKSIVNWATRTGSSAAVTAGATDAALAGEAGLTGLGAIEGLALLTPFGLVAAGGVLLAAALFFTLGRNGYQATTVKSNSNGRPATVQQIAADAGVNGLVTYSDGSSWAYVLVPAGGNATGALPSPWSYFWGQTNADGSSYDLYYYSASGAVVVPPIITQAAPYSNVSTDTQVQAATASPVSTKSMVDLLNSVLGAANAQNSAVPSPALAPFTPADLPTAPLTIGDLIPAQQATPQVAAVVAATSPNSGSPNPTGGTGSTDDTTGFSLPTLPSVAQPPDWIAAWKSQLDGIMPQVPAHSSVCPTISISIPQMDSNLGLSLNTVSFNQHCAIADQVRPNIRIFAQVASAFAAFLSILRA